MRADARRRITLYNQSQISLQGTGSESRGLGPSSSFENRNSWPGSKGKNRNSLAWPRNAGSYFTMTYCTCRSATTAWHCARAITVTAERGWRRSSRGLEIIEYTVSSTCTTVEADEGKEYSVPVRSVFKGVQVVRIHHIDTSNTLMHHFVF